jgi:hypothetical protein
MKEVSRAESSIVYWQHGVAPDGTIDSFNVVFSVGASDSLSFFEEDDFAPKPQHAPPLSITSSSVSESPFL